MGSADRGGGGFDPSPRPPSGFCPRCGYGLLGAVCTRCGWVDAARPLRTAPEARVGCAWTFVYVFIVVLIVLGVAHLCGWSPG